MTTVHQGDVGLELLVDCGCDIAGAANAALLARLPSGIVRTWPAAVAAIDNRSRFLRYVTRPGDLEEAGTYRVQASLSLGGWSGTGKTALLLVRARFS